MNPKVFPQVKLGDIVEIAHPNDEYRWDRDRKRLVIVWGVIHESSSSLYLIKMNYVCNKACIILCTFERWTILLPVLCCLSLARSCSRWRAWKKICRKVRTPDWLSLKEQLQERVSISLDRSCFWRTVYIYESNHPAEASPITYFAELGQSSAHIPISGLKHAHISVCVLKCRLWNKFLLCFFCSFSLKANKAYILNSLFF